MVDGIRAQVIRGIEAFCAQHGLSPDAYSRRFAHSNRFWSSLRDGRGVGLDQIEAVTERARLWAAGQDYGHVPGRHARFRRDVAPADRIAA